MTTIVTAASSNHFKSLLQFVNTIPSGPRVIVYDIGLTAEERARLPLRAIVRQFNFDRYPEFVRLTSPDAGAYAWKPIIVYDVCLEFGGLVIWCDSGNKIFNLSALEVVTRACGLYTAISAGTFETWTHPAARSNLPGSERILGYKMRNAACVGIDWSSITARYLVSDWRTLALRKEISLPDGADRSNHRHDQSILTYLVYGYKLHTVDDKIGHTIHNDID